MQVRRLWRRLRPQRLPTYRAIGISADLHILVNPPAGTGTTRLAATAARRDILTHHRAGPAHGRPAALVMGYSRITPHQSRKAPTTSPPP
ncbi:hypothetical protein [Actinomadura rudentiformis]|uniref:Uncharacterized protein n=1 Tax=Actinomadura rudentiformis TaxID=359158 RepID=A0A6H9YL60_9ACTN|nr:hypothetical protein [Actinomadura rudentiformis]KAB2340016.1 hypothetical protein F8566_46580 [Actinomadura rudentiformis]